MYYLAHHLTHINNLNNILRTGLLARNYLFDYFEDTANYDIVHKRGKLNDYIPFHLNYLQNKYGIPYNYSVCKEYGVDDMIFLSFPVESFKRENLKYLYHPVSKYRKRYDTGKEFIYAIGIEEKKLIEEFEEMKYNENKCKEFLMSEILVHKSMQLDNNCVIYVYSNDTKIRVEEILKNNKFKIKVIVDENKKFFRNL